METSAKTTAQLIQELIAIHAVRKEAANRLTDRVPAPMAYQLSAAKTQSELNTSSLLNELSAFGDAVPADADRNNNYINTWNGALATIDNMEPEECSRLFTIMEGYLQEIYRTVQAETNQLPSSLQQLLNNQYDKLSYQPKDR